MNFKVRLVLVDRRKQKNLKTRVFLAGSQVGWPLLTQLHPRQVWSGPERVWKKQVLSQEPMLLREWVFLQ